MTTTNTSNNNNNNNNNKTPLINPNGKPIRIGCVGGGQLGRMMALESPRLNISMSFLDPLGEDCPAAQASGCQSQSTIVKGKLDDEEKLMELAKNGGDGELVDLVTVEIEHVGVEGLRKLEEQGVSVQPGSRVIGLIQDKFAQKEHFRKSSIPVPPYQQIKSIKCIHEAANELGLPLMLKSRRGAYDGRGNAVLKSISNDDITAALSSLGASSKSVELDLYAEGWIDFECELAVMVVRSITGETRAYPTVNAIQLDSICRVVLAPAREILGEIRHKCEALAQRAIDSLGKGATGVFGVELFLCKSGEVLLNEVAPRPHNTGHYTQDACGVSQFENHLRAISGLPLGDTGMSVGAAAMVNVLGARSGEMSDTIKSSTAALSIPRATVHWYGKAACRAGRKMGHINVTADSPAELDSALREILQLEAVDYEQVVPSSSSSSRRPLTTTTPPPLVGVIMGSSSDLPCMQAAVEMLHKFQIPCEVDIVSAHRTPEKLMSYSRNAARRGIACIIAGAGGAAHLPGMVAAMTPLPVIGVPIKTSTLNGQDSLLSIVQMPRGVPVATVAIGNATNAGLLAVRILAASRIDLREKMEEYQDEMRQTVENTSDQLLDQGSTVFLEGMDNKNMSVNV